VSSTEPLGVSVSRVGEVELCCEDDVVPSVVLFKCLADNALALVARVTSAVSIKFTPLSIA